MKKYITKFSTTEEYESALAMLDFPNTSQVGSNIVFAPNEPEGKVRFINAGGVSVKSVACGVDNTITSSDSNGVRISGGSVEIGECATGLGTGAFATIQDAEIKGMPAEWLIDIPDSAFGLAYPEEGFDLSETQFIGDDAFGGNHHITGELNLPDVVSIGDNAFYLCGEITSVVIGDNCTEIGEMAFRNAIKLSSITLGSGLTRIGSDCFDDTAWYNSQPNNSILYIGNWAVGHKGTPNTTITIPSNITHIADMTFGNLSNVTSITLPDGLVSIGDDAFQSCNSLTSITIPDTVTSIGKEAFYGCRSLTSIVIPEHVTSLGDYTFYLCNSLANVTIPSSVTSISEMAFYNCYFAESNFINNSSATGYPWGATIYQNAVETQDGLIVQNGDTAVKCRKNATSVTIPNGVTSIGDEAFNECSSLTSVTIPDSVTSIGDRAFTYCSHLTSVTIGNGVTSIGDEAFSACSALTSVVIPSSVTSIGDYAFNICTSLASIVMPSSVTSIGESAFQNCSGLTSFTCEATTPPTLGSDALYNTNCPIYVPAESVETYESASVWSTYASRIQAIPDSN